MTIKELLLEGCVIRMSYKDDLQSWVGDVSIYIYQGGCGLRPKVKISGDYLDKEFLIEELDAAIKMFEDFVFSPRNLMYKMNEVLRELSAVNPDIDLDDDRDYAVVRQKINERIYIAEQQQEKLVYVDEKRQRMLKKFRKKIFGK